MGWVFLTIVIITVLVVIAIKSSGWQTSAQGNDTMLYFGMRVTVFRQDGGWKFCVAEPNDRARPYYSNRYSTAERAKAAALAYVDGRSPGAPTWREERNIERRQQAPQILKGAEEKLNAMRKAVSYYKRRKSPTVEQFERLSARLTQARDATIHAHHTLIGCDAPEDIRKAAEEIPLAIISLRADLKAYQATLLAEQSSVDSAADASSDSA